MLGTFVRAGDTLISQKRDSRFHRASVLTGIRIINERILKSFKKKKKKKRLHDRVKWKTGGFYFAQSRQEWRGVSVGLKPES